MAHGQRAAIQSNKRKDYWSRRTYGAPPKSAYSKLLTHREERRKSKQIARKGE